MLEDPLKGRGRPMTPPVITLLERLSPRQEAREWLPAISIIYMAPGGHRQWPMSITALLDRLVLDSASDTFISIGLFPRGCAKGP